MPAYPFYGRIAPDEHDDDQRVECTACDGEGVVPERHPELPGRPELLGCETCDGQGWVE